MVNGIGLLNSPSLEQGTMGRRSENWSRRHRQEEPQHVDNITIYSIFTLVRLDRDSRRTPTRVSKVIVWAMSSLLGVW